MRKEEKVKTKKKTTTKKKKRKKKNIKKKEKEKDNDKDKDKDKPLFHKCMIMRRGRHLQLEPEFQSGCNDIFLFKKYHF